MRIGTRRLAGFAAGAIALLVIIIGCATGGGKPAGNVSPAATATASPAVSAAAARAKPQSEKTQPEKAPGKAQPTRTLTLPAAPPPQAPAPPQATTAPPPAPPAPASCTPLTNGGNCYEPGEYCRNADHGASGVAGDGEAITCEDNDGWRWEPS